MQPHVPVHSDISAYLYERAVLYKYTLPFASINLHTHTRTETLPSVDIHHYLHTLVHILLSALTHIRTHYHAIRTHTHTHTLPSDG